MESEGEIRNAEFLMRRRDGEQVVVLENARAVRDAAGRIIAYEGTIADITERKRAEQAMFAEKERAQVTLQSIGDAVITTDADGRIEYINPGRRKPDRLDARGGARPAASARCCDWSTSSPASRSRTRCCACLRGGEHERAGRSRRAAHPRRPRSRDPGVGGADLRPPGARSIGAVVVFHDVTKERRLKRALSYQASHDALTGLINRREFDNRLHARAA